MRTDYPIFYQQLTAWFREKPARVRGLNVLNEGLKWFVFGSYGLLCVLLWCFQRGNLPISLAVPAATFVLLSFVRAKINRQRPYETYELDPLIHKTTKGHGMLSHHIFSAAVISHAFGGLDRARSAATAEGRLPLVKWWIGLILLKLDFSIKFRLGLLHIMQIFM